MMNDGLSDFSDQYLGKDLTERDGMSDIPNPGLGELPEDLRGMGPVRLPDGSFTAGMEGDMYSTSYATGMMTTVGDIGALDPFRSSIAPVPGSYSNQFNFSAINYLPRANYESFRSQRFFAGGTALLPADPTSFVDLIDDTSVLPPGAPLKFSSGILTVPQGFAAVITGLRQWIGDANAYQKPTGEPDDIVWKISAGGAAIFNFGNFPLVISSLDNEAKLFAIANESTTIQLSVKNNVATSSVFARNIAVKGALTGHWFPMDEIDDVFRNR
jgi:hypothetical protein